MTRDEKKKAIKVAVIIGLAERGILPSEGAGYLRETVKSAIPLPAILAALGLGAAYSGAASAGKGISTGIKSLGSLSLLGAAGIVGGGALTGLAGGKILGRALGPTKDDVKDEVKKDRLSLIEKNINRVRQLTEARNNMDPQKRTKARKTEFSETSIPTAY